MTQITEGGKKNPSIFLNFPRLTDFLIHGNSLESLTVWAVQSQPLIFPFGNEGDIHNPIGNSQTQARPEHIRKY